MKFQISCMIQNTSLERFHSAAWTVKWLNVPSCGKQQISLEPHSTFNKIFSVIINFSKSSFYIQVCTLVEFHFEVEKKCLKL